MKKISSTTARDHDRDYAQLLAFTQARLAKFGLGSSDLLRSHWAERWEQTRLSPSECQELLSLVNSDPADVHAELLQDLLDRKKAKREAAIQAAGRLLKSVLGDACQRVQPLAANGMCRCEE